MEKLPAGRGDRPAQVQKKIPAPQKEQGLDLGLGPGRGARYCADCADWADWAGWVSYWAKPLDL